VHFRNIAAVDQEHFTVSRCHNLHLSIDKDAPKQVFLFVINERTRTVLSPEGGLNGGHEGVQMGVQIGVQKGSRSGPKGGLVEGPD